MDATTAMTRADGRSPWRPQLVLRPSPTATARPARAPAQRSLVERGLRVCAPPDMADEERHDARMIVRALCAWFHLHLDAPLRERRHPDGARTIEVFEAIAFTVHPAHGTVGCAHVRDGRLVLVEKPVEIGMPLHETDWILVVARNLRLFDIRTAVHRSRTRQRALARWVATTMKRLLMHDARFRALRAHGIRDALAIPADVRLIALAARVRFIGPFLKHTTLQAVWQNAAAYRRVARENAQLLPLLFAFHQDVLKGGPLIGDDPVRRLKRHLLEMGVSQAAWRYVSRHGARLFRPVWNRDVRYDGCRFEDAMLYLDLLDKAMRPPPPPPSVARALVRELDPQRLGALSMLGGEASQDLLHDLLHAGLVQAHALRCSREVDGFGETLAQVLNAFDTAPELRKPYVRQRAWAWYLRQWETMLGERERLSRLTGQRWPMHLESFELGPWRIEPIADSATLGRTALRMRNCLASFEAQCIAGAIQIYTIHGGRGRRSSACVAYAFGDDGEVSLDEIAGFANGPVPGTVHRVAQEVALRLQALNQG